jgi:hypothetical protein
MTQPPQWGQQPDQPQSGQPQQPQWGQQFTQPIAPQPGPPGQGPRWARKRIVIPVAAGLFFFGVIIGAAGGGDSTTTASAKPAPTVTVTTNTVTKVSAAPEPAVTVTKTATAKPAAKKTTAAPAGKALFKVWGSAPSGVDITYGSDGENIGSHSVTMSKTLTVKDDALYYQITAQLQGGGDIHCSVTIDGKTKTGHASGGYNICSAQLNSDWSGGFS